MDKETGWYHVSDFEKTEIVYIEDLDVFWRKEYYGNIFGPFKTFAEAKKDAINYHEIDRRRATNLIREVKAIKKPR